MNYTIKNTPLSWRHLRIVAVASLGQLIGTGLATLVSVIIPLYQIIAHPELSSFMQGVIGAMDLIGIMVGSVILGRLSDEYGYLLFFRLCPLIMCASAIIALIFPSIPVLIVSLFFIGFAIGGEYSLDSDYVSQLMPNRWKSTMVGVTKAASAIGNIGVAAACCIIISDWTSAAAWPHLLWIIIVISALMFILRVRFWESPVWLAERGRLSEAERSLTLFLGKDITINPPDSDNNHTSRTTSPGMFLKLNWKKVVFTGIPWACEGLGVYGIGVFLPILVMALGLGESSLGEPPLAHVEHSVQITLWISCIILPGFVIGLLLINRIDGARLQWLGFFASALSLLVLLLSYKYNLGKWLSIGAFMSFELFLNIGPHLMTYVLPSKVYPVEDRGQGAGLAASIGKIGAVLGVFCIPLLLEYGGSTLVLAVSIAVMLLGGIITVIFNPRQEMKTTG
ncbi:MAG: sugar porter family MFS transporter [Muribaculaceae bacterium]|nr:sugar porter family MFS transporter [Muribaculaceae bacterium]